MDKKKVQELQQEEMALWQARIDKAKIQLHLGAKEAKDKMQPQIDKLELAMDQARQKWQEFDEAADDAWEDINEGLKNSFSSLKDAFDKASEHFRNEEED